MSQGKAIAQAGHAYLDSFLASLQTSPVHAASYGALKPGTKIALRGGPPDHILKLHDDLTVAGLPCALIVDEGHIELPDFDGSPTLTALGVGPISRADARRFLSRLPLWPGKGGAS